MLNSDDESVSPDSPQDFDCLVLELSINALLKSVECYAFSHNFYEIVLLHSDHLSR